MAYSFPARSQNHRPHHPQLRSDPGREGRDTHGTIVGGAAAAAASQAREGTQNSGGKQQRRLASAAKPVLRAQVSRGAAVAGPARKAGSRLKH